MKSLCNIPVFLIHLSHPSLSLIAPALVLKSWNPAQINGHWPFFVEFRWLHQLHSTNHENIQIKSIRQWYGISNLRSNHVTGSSLMKFRMKNGGSSFLLWGSVTESTYPEGIQKSDKGWLSEETLHFCSCSSSQTTTRENRKTGCDQRITSFFSKGNVLMMIFLSYVKMHFSYVKSKILNRWLNILLNYVHSRTFFTLKMPTTRPDPPSLPATGLPPHPARHPTLPTTTLPATPPCWPAFPDSLARLVSHYCVASVAMC